MIYKYQKIIYNVITSQSEEQTGEWSMPVF